MAALPLDDTDVLPRFKWERWIGIAVVVGCVLLVFGVSNHGMRFWPFWDMRFGALFRNTTTNGGDMGAHVWWPWFMREHWFGRLRLAGWAPDWYAGFPVGQFYFPLPALLIDFLDLFIPYNVAFKLVTVSGPLLMPVAAYSFGRSLRAPWPMPPAFAVATTVFLFNTRENWQIYGGNLASNLAGEFSYTLAIALCLFFLAAFARTLDTGKQPWLPALLLAATALCHIVVIVFALVAGTLVWVTRRPWRTWPITLAVGAVGGLLAAVWWVPLLLRQPYTQSMRYEKVLVQGTWELPGWVRALLPGPVERLVQGLVRGMTWSTGNSLTLWAPTWVWVFAAIALIGGIVFRRRVTAVLALLTLIFAVMFVQWPPDQHVWNTRFLPLYLLSFALLAGAGAAEIANLVRLLALRAADWVHEGDLADAREAAMADAAAGGDEDAHERFLSDEPAGWLPERLQQAVFERRRATIGALACSLIVIVGAVWGIAGARSARNYLPYWSKWNYTGYESKPAWPEFNLIMQTMDKLPPGRALWEPSSDIDKYGTTLALELLPYFTKGRIGSMEGLYFESSATTPLHFLTVSELTATGKASNPVRGLVYGSINDFDRGVEHLQMLGVRYFMAQSQEAKQHADANRDLRLVAEVPDLDGVAPSGWKIYEVRNSPLVEGLSTEPVVANLHDGTTSSCFGSAPPQPPAHDPHLEPWECATAPWWMNSSLLDKPFAQTGPKSWQHVNIDDLSAVREKPLDPVTVSDIETDVDRISFHVDKPGVPVVVKSSFYPNWRATGADGPYRLSPNLMVVVPTSNDVTLSYGVTGVDWLGRIMTLLGIVGLVLLVRWRPARRHLARTDDDGDGDGEGDDAEPGAGDAGEAPIATTTPEQAPGPPGDVPGPDQPERAPALP